MFMFIAVLRLPHITGDHKIIVGRNYIPDSNEKSLTTIPIIGLFVQLIKTRFFKPFLSDVKFPEYAGRTCKKYEWKERHDFAMLILKARHAIGRILSSQQAEEFFS